MEIDARIRSREKMRSTQRHPGMLQVIGHRAGVGNAGPAGGRRGFAVLSRRGIYYLRSSELSPRLSEKTLASSEERCERFCRELRRARDARRFYGTSGGG